VGKRPSQRIIGETLLWTLTVGVLDWAAFGWAGIALGFAFAVVHIAVRKRESTLSRPVLGAWYLVTLPSLVGIALAAVPIMLWLIVVPCLLVLWLGTPLPPSGRAMARPTRARLAGLLVIVAAVAVSAASPKHLDRSVGPAHYRNVGPSELCTRLRGDHDIRCTVDDTLGEDRIDFEIPHAMSRRDVLRKLADENGLYLSLRGCGTGATLLWGAHYSAYLTVAPAR